MRKYIVPLFIIAALSLFIYAFWITGLKFGLVVFSFILGMYVVLALEEVLKDIDGDIDPTGRGK
jgi:hypothetical protein